MKVVGGMRRLWWEWVLWLMDCRWQRCLFQADEVDPPLAKPLEMVLMVSRSGGLVEAISMRAGWGSWLVGWLGRLSWRESRGGCRWSKRGR